MTKQHAALTYSSYLALDEVLNAQRPRSDEHDEMLFIVIHQVYELWFKQLLHELDHLQVRLEAGDSSHAIRTLRRILTILKVTVAQIDVLETMTPSQFTSFRDRLEASSGFQSGQFRELEAVLGRRDDSVFLHYLVKHGYQVPREILERDVTKPYQPSPEVQDLLLQVYRDDEVPANVCEHLVDLDEGVQEWRYRHVKMVERTIGEKKGTGGSAGATYLRTTVHKAHFPDLWAVRNRL